MSTSTRTSAGLDARQRAEQLKERLADTIEQAWTDIERLNDPKAQALFETTAEVLQGLVTAYEHYIDKAEAAWR